MGTGMNGASSEFAAGAAESLRALIDREEAQQEGLRTQLEASNDRLRRLKRALSALVDDPPARKQSRPKLSGGPPNVNPRKAEQVFEVMRAVGEPMTPTQIARDTEGLSIATAGRAIDALREEGRVRLVGRTRGGGRLYAVIPIIEEAPSAEATAA